MWTLNFKYVSTLNNRCADTGSCRLLGLANRWSGAHDCVYVIGAFLNYILKKKDLSDK